jgi:hypothetical protein
MGNTMKEQIELLKATQRKARIKQERAVCSQDSSGSARVRGFDGKRRRVSNKTIASGREALIQAGVIQPK